jgi:hypothetical protein
MNISDLVQSGWRLTAPHAPEAAANEAHGHLDMVPLRPSAARPPRQGNELEYQPLHESERPHSNFPTGLGFQRFCQISFIMYVLTP